MVEPHNSNFRVITTNFLGVRIFRKLTVNMVKYVIFFVRDTIMFGLASIVCESKLIPMNI